MWQLLATFGILCAHFIKCHGKVYPNNSVPYTYGVYMLVCMCVYCEYERLQRIVAKFID